MIKKIISIIALSGLLLIGALVAKPNVSKETQVVATITTVSPSYVDPGGGGA
jgi:hypothetical protein